MGFSCNSEAIAHGRQVLSNMFSKWTSPRLIVTGLGAFVNYPNTSFHRGLPRLSCNLVNNFQ